MSRYRPASHDWGDCTPLPPASAPDLPGLDTRRADGVLAGAATPAAPAEPRRRPVPLWVWATGLAGLALGGTLWLAADVYSATDASRGLACPSGTPVSVQAATGCVGQGPVYDDEEE
jgi:hypothetical protein